MDYQEEASEGLLALRIAGRMTFNDHIEMKRITRDAVAEGRKAVMIDLSDLEFIDSAAIGMLLILKEEVHKIGGTMSLENPRGRVAKVFAAAKIGELITLNGSSEGPCPSGSIGAEIAPDSVRQQ